MAMRTRVQKWGNSLALRIPKSFAKEVGLTENAAVDLAVRDGGLVIQVEVEPSLRLEDLLAGVTDENLHGEWQTGPPAGKEAR
jgi:antitoxin MazE